MRVAAEVAVPVLAIAVARAGRLPRTTRKRVVAVRVRRAVVGAVLVRADPLRRTTRMKTVAMGAAQPIQEPGGVLAEIPVWDPGPDRVA